jgi:hypothetical protein
MYITLHWHFKNQQVQLQIVHNSKLSILVSSSVWWIWTHVSIFKHVLKKSYNASILFKSNQTRSLGLDYFGFQFNNALLKMYVCNVQYPVKLMKSLILPHLPQLLSLCLILFHLIFSNDLYSLSPNHHPPQNDERLKSYMV